MSVEINIADMKRYLGASAAEVEKRIELMGALQQAIIDLRGEVVDLTERNAALTTQAEVAEQRARRREKRGA